MASRFASLPILLRSRKFRVLPVIADGNCFFRAVATAYHKDEDMHHLLRRILMEHMMEDVEKYLPYFDSPKRLSAVINANKRLGVWNSDLADIVPMAMSELLSARIEVYSLEGEEVAKYVFGEAFGGQKIRLLLKNNHYEILEKN